MKYSTLQTALVFFLPLLDRNYCLNFYGGEPLLHFELIKKFIPFIERKSRVLHKKPRFYITTNGSLITKDILRFLNYYKFSVELSFDGLDQDLNRKRGSFCQIVSSIKEILDYPGIKLEVNSVFTPDTIGHLSESIRLVLGLGVRNVHYSLSTGRAWDEHSLLTFAEEMKETKKIALNDYERTGSISIANFKEGLKKGIFYCAAGKDRLAIAPNGSIWGCYLFSDRFGQMENTREFQKYSFGGVVDFVKNHKKTYSRILSNYAELTMDNFYTDNTLCIFCSELENCAVCPVVASFSGRSLGKIPKYICEIQKNKIKEKKLFWEEIGHVKKSLYYHHRELS